MNRIYYLMSEDYNIKNKYYEHIEESVLWLDCMTDEKEETPNF